MRSLWRWLTGGPDDAVTDYERLLRTNEEQIQMTAKLIRVSKRRARELRRAMVRYSGVVFVAACAVEYVRKPWRLTTVYVLEAGTVILLVPIGVYGARRLLDWYFARKITRLEDKLEELKASQDDKIAEFKRFTNFSKLRELVSKYDDTPEVDLTPEEPPAPSAPHAASFSGFEQGHEDVVRLRRARSVVDRVCDFLLNDGPSNKYALICENCFEHNGLVVREDLERIRYRCSACGHLNSRALPGTDLQLEPAMGSPYQQEPAMGSPYLQEPVTENVDGVEHESQEPPDVSGKGMEMPAIPQSEELRDEPDEPRSPKPVS
ncbi:unnamed protein product (mitochondrion) [Plasmodiophora brassicae]|uniref:Endoplasmic reticulum junction formation protein lunapark n=1 Tax=Plasmodiophora brassicae TaxID=37360 RepID=A0A0G4ISV4_PLABS|nr:hypothetical protein PBRA_006334 [Plasmodiophora brassicae]SPQ95208.1 unnamed protein product [Plasmodiophora brassicae]